MDTTKKHTIKFKDLYNKTAEVLERDGWHKGDYHCNGKHCTLGAISVAVGEMSGIDDDSVLCSWDFDKLAQPLVNSIGTGVVKWNDDILRTEEEVLFELRRIAELAGDSEIEVNLG